VLLGGTRAEPALEARPARQGATGGGGGCWGPDAAPRLPTELWQSTPGVGRGRRAPRSLRGGERSAPLRSRTGAPAVASGLWDRHQPGLLIGTISES
jgi:hypothetical protein